MKSKDRESTPRSQGGRNQRPKGKNFYLGKGFADLSGPQAPKVREATEALRKIRSSVSPKGNLFDPVVTAQFPGAPTGLPVNWLLFPDRGFDYCLIHLQPGANWPMHLHGYGQEVYVVIKGKGKVTLEETEYDAAEWDVFHIHAGIPHTMRNTEADSDFCVLAINTPAVSHELRSQYWAVPMDGE